MARILVIDDDPQVRRMLREVLEDEGYEVEEAENGDVGLKFYRAQPADLVISDLIMPEKEGLETIRELQKISPTVKTIAISGGGRVVPRDYLRIALGFGAQRVLQKPVDFDELLNAITDLLNR